LSNKQHIFVLTGPPLDVNSGDLSRYIAGEVDLFSIQAVAVNHSTPPGHLSALSIDESEIPQDQRIPRVTSALWYIPFIIFDFLEIYIGCSGDIDTFPSSPWEEI
jgi:hypothetical protein